MLSLFLACFCSYRGTKSSDFCCLGERFKSGLSTLIFFFLSGSGLFQMTSFYSADMDVDETSEQFPNSVFPSKDWPLYFILTAIFLFTSIFWFCLWASSRSVLWLRAPSLLRSVSCNKRSVISHLAQFVGDLPLVSGNVSVAFASCWVLAHELKLEAVLKFVFCCFQGFSVTGLSKSLNADIYL